MKLNANCAIKSWLAIAVLAFLAVPAFAAATYPYYDCTGGVMGPRENDLIYDWGTAVPNGTFTVGDADGAFDGDASMTLDLGSVPTQNVRCIMIQNPVPWANENNIARANIYVSSHEGEAGFDPRWGVFDIKVADNAYSGGPSVSTPAGWRWINLSGAGVAKRYFVIEATETSVGPVSSAPGSRLWFGDLKPAYELQVPVVSYPYYLCTGGVMGPRENDLIYDWGTAVPNGTFTVGDADGAFDGDASMTLDLGNVPTQNVRRIMIQNPVPWANPNNIARANIYVSSHEGEAGFDPRWGVFDIKVADNAYSEGPSVSTPAGWRWINLSGAGVGKRYFVIEATETSVGSVSSAPGSRLWFGDLKPAYDLYQFPTISHGSVIVDGDLTDWADANWITMDYNYQGDTSQIEEAYYAAKWDSATNKVYVAVKVKDNIPVFSEYPGPWDGHGDAIEVYFHTTGDSLASNLYYTNYADAQQFVIGVMDSDHNSVWAGMGNGAPVSSYAQLQTGGNYDGVWMLYEVGMTPFHYYDKEEGANVIDTLQAGGMIGLDVTVGAYDGFGYCGMKSATTQTGLWEDWSRFTVAKLSAPPAPISISDAKKKAVGEPVSLTGVSITAVFSDSIYVEASDRSSGIRVDKSAHGFSSTDINKVVTVTGTIAKDSATDEIYVNATGINPTGATEEILPLGLTNKAAGGGSFVDEANNGQAGVDGGAGLNNIGLLIKTTGLASDGDANGFTITDGSGVVMQVALANAGTAYNGKHVTVTGISCIGSGGVRVIKARNTDDVQQVN